MRFAPAHFNPLPRLTWRPSTPESRLKYIRVQVRLRLQPDQSPIFDEIAKMLKVERVFQRL